MLIKIHGENVNLNEQTLTRIFGEDEEGEPTPFFEIGFSDNDYYVVARKSIWDRDLQHEPILWATGSNGDKIPGCSVRCLLENIWGINGLGLNYVYDRDEKIIYGYTLENYGDKDKATVCYTIEYDNNYFDKETNVQKFLKGAYLYQGYLYQDDHSKDFDDDDIEIVS